MHSYILTDAPSAEYVYQLLRKDNAEGLVIVPSWGLNWNHYSRSLMLCSTKETFIRTSYGDPGRDERRHLEEYKYSYLLKESLIELEDFLRLKPHSRIILGNEPNLDHVNFWVYRYWLLEAIKICRARYPYAELVSPAPTVDVRYIHKAHEFYNVCKDALMLCDYSGIHAYDVSSFITPTTNQLNTAIELSRRYLGAKPIMLTECGLNSMILTPKGKLAEYAKMRAKYPFIKAFCIFHISQGKEFPFYNIELEDV